MRKEALTIVDKLNKDPLTQQKWFIPKENDDDDDIEMQWFEPDDGKPTGFITGGYMAELTIKRKSSPKKIKLNQYKPTHEPHLNFLRLDADVVHDENQHDLIKTKTSKLTSNNLLKGKESMKLD